MTGVAWAAAVPAAASPVFLGIALARRRRDVALDELLEVGPSRSGWRGQTLGAGIGSRSAAMCRLLRSASIVLGLGVGSVLAGPPGALAGLAAAVFVPIWLRRRKFAKDEQRIEEQLADGVASIAAGLRAGLSLSQAIRLAAVDGEPPLSDTLRAIADREALGGSLAASLDAWLVASHSADLRLLGNVLQLHRKTGGDLPSVLDEVARTLHGRRAATREIRGYTAQARLSGAILGLLPIGFFLFLSATSRQDIALAYHSPVGQTAIGTGLALEAGAFLWIRRLLRVAP